jgi:tetratricopeptide (TPR) repeat protein
MFCKFRRSLFLAVATLCLYYAPTSAFQTPSDVAASTRDQLKKEWLERSVDYYSKVMRVERQRNLGTLDEEELDSIEYQRLAQKHWFAIRKVKEGQYQQAEIIYKRIINEIMAEEDGCDHAKLAVTTLLLALHCQRMGDLKKTRSVFLSFFREVVVKQEEDGHSKCACSAKVLGAFALFEMKRGNAKKAFEIAREAVKFDPALAPVLNWKQFRDAKASTNKKADGKLSP